MASQPFAQKKKPPPAEAHNVLKKLWKPCTAQSWSRWKGGKARFKAPISPTVEMNVGSPRSPRRDLHRRCEKCGTRIWAGFRECGNEQERRWTASISPTVLMDHAKRVRAPNTPETSETEDAGSAAEYAQNKPHQECIESSETEVITVSSPTTFSRVGSAAKETTRHPRGVRRQRTQ